MAAAVAVVVVVAVAAAVVVVVVVVSAAATAEAAIVLVARVVATKCSSVQLSPFTVIVISTSSHFPSMRSVQHQLRCSPGAAPVAAIPAAMKTTSSSPLRTTRTTSFASTYLSVPPASSFALTTPRNPFRACYPGWPSSFQTVQR